VIIGGPNGAGKTTAAPTLLQGELSVEEFVNADVIASGLSAFNAAGAAITAGRVMLTRLRELARRRKSFAFESTLASRLLASWLAELKRSRFRIYMLFLWLPDPEAALLRVATRVRLGGHAVPNETVLRRYHAGIENFFELYQPLATSWRVYDSSGAGVPRLIAFGRGRKTIRRLDRAAWRASQKRAKSS
jgi:predicted ABC-type ATPase